MTPMHTDYLMKLFQAMSDAGFENTRIDDEDLRPLSIDEHGSIAVIKEMQGVDDMIVLKSEYPRPDGSEPAPVQLLFYLGNDPHESLVDYTIPSQTVDEKLTAILDKLEEKYV